MWRKRRLMLQTTTVEFQIPVDEEEGVAGVKATL
jgi:hypothetical protein